MTKISILTSYPLTHLRDLITLIAGLSLVSIPVHAEDGKVYPGGMCQTSLGNGFHSGGAIRNESDIASLMVECPVVRDKVNGGSGRDAEVEKKGAQGINFNRSAPFVADTPS